MAGKRLDKARDLKEDSNAARHARLRKKRPQEQAIGSVLFKGLPGISEDPGEEEEYPY